MGDLHTKGFFPATSMPDRDWWAALWPDPEGVLRQAGVKAGLKCLDLCCGDGYFTAPLAGLVSPEVLVAVDLSPEMIRMARAEVEQAGHGNAKFITGAAEDLAKLVETPLEWVWIANTFHGVPEKLELSRLVGEVLGPDGLFVILNWHKRPREETPVLGKPRGPALEMRMTPEDTRQVVEPAGFLEVAVENVGTTHYLSMFRRV